MLKVQFVPGASEVDEVQLLAEVKAKSADAPVIAAPLSVSVELPELVSVSAWTGLVWPTMVLGKLNELGDSVTCGGAVAPTPVSVTVCGELGALSVRVTVAVRVPVVCGLKVMLKVQLALGASELVEAPQVLAEVKAKSVEDPLTAALLSVSVAVPELVSVST